MVSMFIERARAERERTLMLSDPADVAHGDIGPFCPDPLAELEHGQCGFWGKMVRLGLAIAAVFKS